MSKHQTENRENVIITVGGAGQVQVADIQGLQMRDRKGRSLESGGMNSDSQDKQPTFHVGGSRGERGHLGGAQWRSQAHKFWAPPCR